ncbi:MAG: hypothetical protein QGD95_03315, partial [Actinomycetota bacterium]|nr:hypothetical protein [Actinomycetota bacterium]
TNPIELFDGCQIDDFRLVDGPLHRGRALGDLALQRSQVTARFNVDAREDALAARRDLGVDLVRALRDGPGLRSSRPKRWVSAINTPIMSSTFPDRRPLGPYDPLRATGWSCIQA